MFGFICLEGCHSADHLSTSVVTWECTKTSVGRHEHLEQLNEGDGVILAFLKANIAEKERGWHINNGCRTVEHLLLGSRGEASSSTCSPGVA